MKKYNGTLPPRKFSIDGNFEVQGRAVVDGDWWYTVQVAHIVQPWIWQQPRDLWYDHLSPNHYRVVSTFDIHEKIYTMLALRWS